MKFENKYEEFRKNVQNSMYIKNTTFFLLKSIFILKKPKLSDIFRNFIQKDKIYKFSRVI